MPNSKIILPHDSCFLLDSATLADIFSVSHYQKRVLHGRLSGVAVENTP